MEPGLQVGAFRLVEHLGVGGMGQVWRAHNDAGQAVAIKLVSTARSDDPWARAALAAEIRIVATLCHPAIVRILDHGVVGDATWLALELASGALQVQARTFEQVRRLLLGILDGLAHAHARDVLHLDLKPPNVLVRTLGGLLQPQLADFGLAAKLDELEGRRVAGSPAYMAPEQFTQRRHSLGPWTDMYGIGCMAFELLTGRLPFEGGSSADLARAHRNTPAPRIERHAGLPAGVADWVGTLLQKDSADRFQSAAAASAALARLGTAENPARPALTGAEDSVAELTFAPTMTLPIDSWTAPIVASRVHHAAPALPRSWRTARSAWPTVPPKGSGLALVGLKSLPMIGREAERTELWRALHRASAAQRPEVLRVVGPPGVGRTALVSWLVHRAREVGVTSAVLASAQPGQLAGHTLLDVVRQLEVLNGGLLPGSVADLDRIESAGPRAPAALARVVSELARSQPAVIAIDDAELDPMAEDIARAALAHDQGQTLVVLTHGLGATVPEGEGVRLDLEPLASRDHLFVIEELLHLPAELAGYLAERTDGHPGAAVEVVTDWVARGVLTAGPHGWQLVGERPELPERVVASWRGSVRTVLEALSEHGHQALLRAAALGDRVDLAEWARVAAVDGMEQAVDAAARAGLGRTSQGRFELAHPGVRAAIREAAIEVGAWARECGWVADQGDVAPVVRAELLLDGGRAREALAVLDGMAIGKGVAQAARLAARAVAELPELEPADQAVAFLLRLEHLQRQGRLRELAEARSGRAVSVDRPRSDGDRPDLQDHRLRRARCGDRPGPTHPGPGAGVPVLGEPVERRPRPGARRRRRGQEAGPRQRARGVAVRSLRGAGLPRARPAGRGGRRVRRGTSGGGRHEPGPGL
jgi:hypothetical protein